MYVLCTRITYSYLLELHRPEFTRLIKAADITTIAHPYGCTVAIWTIISNPTQPVFLGFLSVFHIFHYKPVIRMSRTQELIRFYAACFRFFILAAAIYLNLLNQIAIQGAKE